MPDQEPKPRKFRLFKDHEVTVSTDIAEEWDNIKSHFRRNKTTYVSVGVAGITYLITRNMSSPNIRGAIGVPARSANWGVPGENSVKLTPLAFLSKQTVNTVTVFDTEGPGRSGILTKCLENGRHYPSQSKAAKALGISQSNLSQHLNGLQDSVNGLHFERFAEKT